MEFEPGADGLPVPGKVVKYFREQMRYTDADGNVKHWTQKDLAERLGVSELMVRLMETQNKGLDSVERRRTLVTLLKIPPALLGLSSLEDALEVLPTSPKKNTVALYRNILIAYEKLYRDASSIEFAGDIKNTISLLRGDIQTSGGAEKRLLLYILWELCSLVNKIATYDTNDWGTFYTYIDEALEAAKELNDINLYVLSLNQSCSARYIQGNGNLARLEAYNALKHARTATPLVRAKILAEASKAYTLNTTDLGDRASAKQFMEQSFKMLSTVPKSDHIFVPDARQPLQLPWFTAVITMTRFSQFDGLRLLHRISEAGLLLDEIEGARSLKLSRDIALFKLHRAKCTVASKQYEQSLYLLVEAMHGYKDIGSVYNVREMVKVYKQIAQSPYGNAPEVVDVGVELKKLHR